MSNGKKRASTPAPDLRIQGRTYSPAASSSQDDTLIINAVMMYGMGFKNGEDIFLHDFTYDALFSSSNTLSSWMDSEYQVSLITCIFGGFILFYGLCSLGLKEKLYMSEARK